MGDVKGKIDSLTPEKHYIEIQKGKKNLNPANQGSFLSLNDRLIVPGGGSQAAVSFVNNNQPVTGYKVVVGPNKKSGRYKIPCQVSDGQIAVGWEDGKRSGCQRVRVNSQITIKDQTITSRPLSTTSSDGAISSEIPAATAPIDNSHWAARYIQTLAEKGIMKGYPNSGEDSNNKFRPDSPVTREEFASLISAANLYFKAPEIDRTIQFPDVEGRRSQSAIALAVRTSFLSGYKDGLFRPTQPIPQEQVMVALARGLGLIQNPDISLLANYAGGNEVSDWARRAVAAAIQAGIIVDPDNKVLTPQQRSTRGEVAAFMYRALVSKGVIHEEAPPTNDNFLLFSQPNETGDDPEEQGPEVWVAPQSTSPTLILADSAEQIEITSLTATVNVQAVAMLQSNPTAAEPTTVSSTTPAETYVELGQRYTYFPTPDGHYQGRLTVLSREERRTIVQSEPVQTLIHPADWPPEIPPPTTSYQRIFQEDLLKKKPVQIGSKTVQGINCLQTTIDLTDPDTLLTIGLGKNADRESDPAYGGEPFDQFVKRYADASIVASGTFFNVDPKSPKFNELYGNMIGAGQFLRYQPWEARGTALLIGEGNRPAMVNLQALKAQGQTPPWDKTWFYLTAGPRLLNAGAILSPGAPAAEGFQAPNLADINQLDSRTAIGFSKDGHFLYLVTFLAKVSLKQAAEVMQAIGCYEAMNLDGGSSVALARDGKALAIPKRNLTHALVVYDASHLAPANLRTQWDQFQAGTRRPQPVPTNNLNKLIVQAMVAKGMFDTTAGSDGGVNACVWAVNRILEQAGIPTLKNPAGVETNYVPDVEKQFIASGRGKEILPPEQAQPGDLVIAANQAHMGICFDVTTTTVRLNGSTKEILKFIVRSNGSTPKKFYWESGLNFWETDTNPKADYGQPRPSKVYRLLQ